MKRPYFQILTLAVALGIAACSDDDGLPKPTREGVEETKQFPPVVYVQADIGGPCTGTFISPQVILSAAHCFPDGTGVISIRNDQVEGTGQLLARMSVPFDGINPYDIALVFFNTRLRRELPFYSLATKVNEGDTVRLVGYGNLQSQFDNKKRTGTNQIFRLDQFIQLKFAQPSSDVRGARNRVGGTRGDSGGPGLFFDGVRYLVAGVVQSRDNNSPLTYLVNVTHPTIRAYLESVNRRFSLTIPGL